MVSLTTRIAGPSPAMTIQTTLKGLLAEQQAEQTPIGAEILRL
jgi:hypothetical protein